MKIKTSELSGAALDWAVAQCVGKKKGYAEQLVNDCRQVIPYSPSVNWNQGGLIIHKNRISVMSDSKDIEKESWLAENYDGDNLQFGPTPLIAAMRCFISSKLGDEVEIPEDILSK